MCCKRWTYLLVVVLSSLFLSACGFDSEGKSLISKEAAASCDLKVKQLQAFAEQNHSNQLKTSFSEEEINSYLALELSPTFHPSLKSIVFEIKKPNLIAVMKVDFDRLGLSRDNLLTQLLTRVLSGVHILTLHGTLISNDGKAHFQLAEAIFDTQTLPKIVVEEIIRTVGQRQNPPFNPLEPSDLPYKIKEVEINTGYITMVQ